MALILNLAMIAMIKKITSGSIVSLLAISHFGLSVSERTSCVLGIPSYTLPPAFHYKS